MSQNTSPPRPGMEGPMLAFRFMDLAPILLEAPKIFGGRSSFCFSLVRPVLMFFFDMKIEKVFDDLFFFFQMFFLK